MKPYLTVAQVAQAEGISERRVRFLCAQGRIHHADRLGSAWVILLNYYIVRKPVGRPRKKPPRYAQSTSPSK